MHWHMMTPINSGLWFEFAFWSLSVVPIVGIIPHQKYITCIDTWYIFSRTPTTSGAPPVWPGIYVKPLLEPIVEITCGAPLWPGICAHCGDAGYHSLLTRWHRQQVALHLHTGELLIDQKQQNWRAPNGPKTAKLKSSLWTKNSKTEELLMDQKQQNWRAPNGPKTAKMWLVFLLCQFWNSVVEKLNMMQISKVETKLFSELNAATTSFLNLSLFSAWSTIVPQPVRRRQTELDYLACNPVAQLFGLSQ